MDLNTLFAVAVALITCCVPAFVRCQTPSPAASSNVALETQLHEIAASHHGQVALYARQLKTGQTVALHPDAPVQTASVIKLAILYEAMEQVRAGKAHWDDRITLVPDDAVSGSGILLFFDAPQTFTLKDILTLMVIMSDNTAANLAITRLGLDNINNRIASLGLKDTHLYKKIGKPAEGPMPADQPKFGLGKTTPREMASLMERIARCELDPEPVPTLGEQDSAICAVALKMLRNQFYRDTVPRYLEKLDTTESGSGTASKTGSLNAVRNDVAIVAGKSGPIVISAFTYDNTDTGWTADNEGGVDYRQAVESYRKRMVPRWYRWQDPRPRARITFRSGACGVVETAFRFV